MKSTMTRLMIAMAIASVVLGPALAGDLEPPGSPAPTMVTLQQIFDKIDTLVPGPIAVAKTGQTGCWNAAGTGISCTGTGQDGAYQAGASASPRFTDNGNVTVKDNLTGLIWLKNANCFGLRNWTNSLADANALASGACGLTDGSVAGNWRLPNVRELHSLIDLGQSNPAIPLTHPFSDVKPDNYWSSTTYALGTTGGWGIYFLYGLVQTVPKANALYVWPVRGGL